MATPQDSISPALDAVHRALHDAVYDALRTLESFDIERPDPVLELLVPVAQALAGILEQRLNPDEPPASPDPDVVTISRADFVALADAARLVRKAKDMLDGMDVRMPS